MKKKFIILLIIISLSILAFQFSPYARRVRPFATTPASCQENEIGYNMTSHTLLICTNAGYQSLATGSGFTCGNCASNVIQKGDGAGNFAASRVTDDGTDITIAAAGLGATGVISIGNVGAGENYLQQFTNAVTSEATFEVYTTSPSLAHFTQITAQTTNTADTRIILGADSTSVVVDGANSVVRIDSPVFTPTTTGITDLGTSSLGFKQAFFDATITASGTTGNQTINKSAGSVNVAAGGTSITVTSDKVTTNSIVIPIAGTNDATCFVKNAVKSAGSVTFNMSAACTAETRIDFWVLNQWKNYFLYYFFYFYFKLK